jgi:hypothetical protein
MLLQQVDCDLGCKRCQIRAIRYPFDLGQSYAVRYTYTLYAIPKYTH